MSARVDAVSPTVLFWNGNYLCLCWLCDVLLIYLVFLKCFLAGEIVVINLEKYLLILHYIQGVRYILNAKRDVSLSFLTTLRVILISFHF